jgi:hypothetical protein
MDDPQTPVQDDANPTPTTPVVPKQATPEPVTTQTEVTAAIEAMRSAHATELDRIAGIRRIYNGALPSLEARAIREGWNLEKAELEKIRATRPAVPAIHVQNNTINASVLEAACFMAANLSNVEEVPPVQRLGSSCSEAIRSSCFWMSFLHIWRMPLLSQWEVPISAW